MVTSFEIWHTYWGQFHNSFYHVSFMCLECMPSFLNEVPLDSLDQAEFNFLYCIFHNISFYEKVCLYTNKISLECLQLCYRHNDIRFPWRICLVPSSPLAVLFIIMVKSQDHSSNNQPRSLGNRFEQTEHGKSVSSD